MAGDGLDVVGAMWWVLDSGILGLRAARRFQGGFWSWDALGWDAGEHSDALPVSRIHLGDEGREGKP